MQLKDIIIIKRSGIRVYVACVCTLEQRRVYPATRLTAPEARTSDAATGGRCSKPGAWRDGSLALWDHRGHLGVKRQKAIGCNWMQLGPSFSSLLKGFGPRADSAPCCSARSSLTQQTIDSFKQPSKRVAAPGINRQPVSSLTRDFSG